MARARLFRGPLLALALLGPGGVPVIQAAEPAKKPAPASEPKKPPAEKAPAEPKKAAAPAKPGSIPEAPAAQPGSAPALKPPDAPQGQGTRKIEPVRVPAPASSVPPAAAAPIPKKGKAPQKPLATLPA